MLTGYQCETVAFLAEGDWLCPDCAVEAYGPLTVAKAERGLATGDDLSAISRYGLDEYQGEATYCHALEEHEESSDAFEAAVEAYPDEVCGSCGRELS